MNRAEKMREVFTGFESSGLSLRAFGQREGIPYAKLLYWKKKFAVESRGGVAGMQPASAALSPVVVVPDAPPAAARRDRFEVWLPNGVSLDVPPGFDGGELQQLIRALGEC